MANRQAYIATAWMERVGEHVLYLFVNFVGGAINLNTLWWDEEYGNIEQRVASLGKRIWLGEIRVWDSCRGAIVARRDFINFER